MVKFSGLLACDKETFLFFADSFPPPKDIYVTEANASQLVFRWEPVEPLCEAVHYLINASNCGHCPNVINDSTVTCTGFSLDMYDQVCLFSVRTVVCGNIIRNESRSIQVTLRGMSYLACVLL